MERTRPARTALERLTEVLRDALAGIPTYWRNHLINPVTDKLRAARERFGKAVRNEGDRPVGNERVSEAGARLQEAAERLERARGRSMRGHSRNAR